MAKEAAKINPVLLPTPEETRERTISIKYKRDKDREKVKGIFKNYETRGGTITFNFRAYPGDEIEKYILSDGMTYSLPLGVAKHLNKNCFIEQHAPMPDGTIQGVGVYGKQMTAVTKVKRFGFQSLEFIDDEDLSTTETPSNLVTVRMA